MAVVLGGVVFIGPVAMAGWYGPTTYRSFADSPFAGFTYSGYFHLENFEDGLVNTPGLTMTPVLGGGSVLADGTASSVDLDDGLIDGTSSGKSYLLGFGSFTISSRLNLTFDPAALGGQLPTDVGFVRVVGLSGDMSINIYDASNSLVSTILHGVTGNPFSYTTDDDRFFGYRHLPGISRVEIINPLGSYTQFDHIQYGAFPSPVPETSTVGAGAALAVLCGWGVLRRR
jgi:hypothetical protein